MYRNEMKKIEEIRKILNEPRTIEGSNLYAGKILSDRLDKIGKLLGFKISEIRV